MMDWFVKAFLKASLAWLAMGVTLGAAMAAHPRLAGWRTAHIHMQLLGFVAMMIFGVAYHVIPRFTGHPLHSRRLAGAHWWISNTGLALFAVGFGLRGSGVAPGGTLVAPGGILSSIGAYAFVYNLWRTLDGRAELRRVAPIATPVTRRPPIVESA